MQAQEEAKATVKVIYEGSGSVLLGKYDKDNDGRNYFESGLLEYTFNIGEYAIVNAKCEDDVEFLIVQLPGFILESNQDFKIHKPAFKYDKEFMDRIFDFAIKKSILLKNQEEEEKNKEK